MCPAYLPADPADLDLTANAAAISAALADLQAAGSAWASYQAHKRLAALHRARTAYFHAHPLAPHVPRPLG